MSVVVVGDALLDRDLDGRAERLAPDAPVPVVDAIVERPRPGGAGLAAALAAAAGARTTLVCALGDDRRGRLVADLLRDAGVVVCDLELDGATPEKVRVRVGGRALIRLDSGGDGACGRMTAEAERALRGASAVLVSDYGRGVTSEPSLRAAIAAAHAPVVWDPHPRGAAPVPGVMIATPNESEAGAMAAAHEARETGAPRGRAIIEPNERAVGLLGATLVAAEASARLLAARWRAVHVCVTRGAHGALLVAGDGPALAVPAPPVVATDPCGGGDSFAAAAAVCLANGALPSEAVRAAVNAASEFVAAGRAEAPTPLSVESAAGLAQRARAAGRTVVAAGGCFDLLHAGHVRTLEAARALGDRLIVCLNSDASVRRLKGADRPLVAQDDRAAVLAALGCVDAVAVFDEDDPGAILRELRPHVWVKGGDHAVGELPEAAVLSDWGGIAVVVPYVAGRSTTWLIEAARA